MRMKLLQILWWWLLAEGSEKLEICLKSEYSWMYPEFGGFCFEVRTRLAECVAMIAVKAVLAVVDAG
jgi:hypothetical protein